MQAEGEEGYGNVVPEHGLVGTQFAWLAATSDDDTQFAWLAATSDDDTSWPFDSADSDGDGDGDGDGERAAMSQHAPKRLRPANPEAWRARDSYGVQASLHCVGLTLECVDDENVSLSIELHPLAHWAPPRRSPATLTDRNVYGCITTLYYTFWRFTSPFAVCERRHGDCRGDCRGDWRGGACVAITAAVSASTTLVSA
eukprot:COSAG06_NODE_5801_length_3266_cov_19.872750_1_plen_198_part_10